MSLVGQIKAAHFNFLVDECGGQAPLLCEDVHSLHEQVVSKDLIDKWQE